MQAAPQTLLFPAGAELAHAKLGVLRYAPMTLADVPEVMAIETSVYPFPWTFSGFCDSLQAGYWGTCLRHAAGELLAYSLVMPVVDEVHLLNLAVAAAQQGQGLGRSLLDAMCRQAREAGMASVLLEVRPTNRAALHTYQRYGFKEIGRRKGYYPTSEAGGPEDAIVMRLSLAVGKDAR